MLRWIIKIKGEKSVMKKYSKYNNPKSKELNSKEVEEGSIITARLSDYEKLPKNVKDHKREAVVVLKFHNKELGVVYIHGLLDRNNILRIKKEEAGLWKKIMKSNQEVYVDLDIRTIDSKGNPIKQGSTFKNTGVKLSTVEFEKVKNHVFEAGKRKHSVRNIVRNNKALKNKKS